MPQQGAVAIALLTRPGQVKYSRGSEPTEEGPSPVVAERPAVVRPPRPLTSLRGSQINSCKCLVVMNLRD